MMLLSFYFILILFFCLILHYVLCYFILWNFYTCICCFLIVSNSHSLSSHSSTQFPLSRISAAHIWAYPVEDGKCTVVTSQRDTTLSLWAVSTVNISLAMVKTCEPILHPSWKVDWCGLWRSYAGTQSCQEFMDVISCHIWRTFFIILMYVKPCFSLTILIWVLCIIKKL